MFSGIPYSRYLDTPTCRVSLDNIRIKFTYSNTCMDFPDCHSPEWHKPEKRVRVLSVDRVCRSFDLLYFQFDPNYDVTWAHCEFFKLGKYAHTATVKGKGWSCAVLIGRYDCNPSYKNQIAPEAVLDINPNKVPAEWVNRLVAILTEQSRQVEVVRYDVAFDFPIPRDNVTLVPNNRQSYKLFRDSGKGTTEYQGERSHHAALKLYDKSKESDLTVPVTRCELTVKGGYQESLETLFPHLTCFADLQLDLPASDLPFDVVACIAYPDLIPELRRRVSSNTWRKYKPMIESYGRSRIQPENWQEIDQFVRSTIRDIKGGRA